MAADSTVPDEAVAVEIDEDIGTNAVEINEDTGANAVEIGEDTGTDTVEIDEETYGTNAVEIDEDTGTNAVAVGDDNTDAIGADNDTFDDNGVDGDADTVVGGVDGANVKFRHDLKHANTGGARTISVGAGRGVDAFILPIFLCKSTAFLMMAALNFSSNSELASLS